MSHLSTTSTTVLLRKNQEAEVKLIEIPSYTSCLRSPTKKNGITRNVSFPEDENQIVVNILEPESRLKSASSAESLLSSYRRACEKYGCPSHQSIEKQLLDLDLTLERNECLSLEGIKLDAMQCEALEEILKHIRFNCINLRDTCLNDNTAVTLFDMIEFYESAVHLNLSCNHNMGMRAWQMFSKMIRKSKFLEHLEVRDGGMPDVYVPIFGRMLKNDCFLHTLKLEQCQLSGKPLGILCKSLMSNSYLKELYLAENNLNSSDACQLSLMLKSNTALLLLDISHNYICDTGMTHLVDGMVDQLNGITALIAWNNNLTKGSSIPVAHLLDELTNVEMLNVGSNYLGDDFVNKIYDAFCANKNLLRLGMQNTHLTCASATLFAQSILKNDCIRRIDLRGNDLLLTGVTTLLESVEKSETLTQLDIDKAGDVDFLLEYAEVIEKIQAHCVKNEKKMLERACESFDSVDNMRVNQMKNKVCEMRKISLTCVPIHPVNTLLAEPKEHRKLRSPAPSPIASPIASPALPRSQCRFKVFKVEEKPPSGVDIAPIPPPSPSKSRFKVTVVQPESPTFTENTQTLDASITGSPHSNETSNILSQDDLKMDSSCIWMRTDKNESNNNLEGAILENSPSNENLDNSLLGKLNPEGSPHPSSLADRIRNHPWVMPVLKSSDSLRTFDASKIPGTLEKFLNSFQNPFTSRSEGPSRRSSEPFPEIDSANNVDSFVNSAATWPNDASTESFVARQSPTSPIAM